ncbi:hypothetical protein [Streptomyces violascens]|uniref:Uncharacterized protein n=1 Tax=Streptomyces violascens TaxID=67381 RepID=A0ABQ3QX89_9ACTN|nr:hypothetical protein [Streptomyces violascens]GGU12995.1 hypothetical protein GCM10010289_38280 [Streptomyces violascens]GHI41878.1 hypothetical protein Sviol_62860 [Streptomyces violascens]
MTAAPQRVTAALFIDMTNGRARYECLLCGARAGPVQGRRKVAEFVQTIRANHRAECPHLHQQGAHAA